MKVEGQAIDEILISSLETFLDSLHKKNKMLNFKGCLHPNNIRIVGIPEGAEKRRPSEFVADLIKQLFVDFSYPPVIDRAHWVLQPKPPEGAKDMQLLQ